jgi:hypothetical protein
MTFSLLPRCPGETSKSRWWWFLGIGSEKVLSVGRQESILWVSGELVKTCVASTDAWDRPHWIIETGELQIQLVLHLSVFLQRPFFVGFEITRRLLMSER